MKRTNFIVLSLALTTVAGVASHLPMAYEAWSDSTNVVEAYYESVSNEYPNIGGVVSEAISYGDASFSPTNGVVAYDREDGYLPFTVSGTVDVFQAGAYTLNYAATDSTTQTVRFARTIEVLPSNEVAVVEVNGRFGSNDVRRLDSSYENTLATNLTFIAFDVTAPRGTIYRYWEIDRAWPDGTNAASNVTAPSEADWAATTISNEFYRDLHIFMRPRVDRWVRVQVEVGTNSITQTFGLKGDPGEEFVSPADGSVSIRLSRPVDDPMSAAQQHVIMAQGINYGYSPRGYPWPVALQKRMGISARQITTQHYGNSTSMEMVDEEMHGRPVLERYYNMAGGNDGTKASYWEWAEKRWADCIGRERYTSHYRSYQIPGSEYTVDDYPAIPREYYIASVERVYARLRSIESDRLLACAPVGISQFGMYDSMVYTNLNGVCRTGFPYKLDPYFISEFHSPGAFEHKIIDFESMPFCGIYTKAKMKQVSDHSAPAYYYEQLRNWVRLSKVYGDKTAICLQEQFLIVLRNPDGSFKFYALPYVAMRHGYIGSHYLNNQEYFADDCDGDGLSNELEQQIGSNPFNADSDGDYIFDSDEYDWGLDILRDDAHEDLDGDGYDNVTEALYSKDVGWKIRTKTIYAPLLDENGNPATNENGEVVYETLRADVPNGRLFPKADRYIIPASGSLQIAAPGTRGNDKIVGTTSNVVAILVDAPTNGIVTLNGDGSFVYEPNRSASGDFEGDVFTYRLDDGLQHSLPTKVTLPPRSNFRLLAAWNFDETNGVIAVDVSSNGWDVVLSEGSRTNGYEGGAVRMTSSHSIALRADWRVRDWTVVTRVFAPTGWNGGHENLLCSTNTCNLALYNWENGHIAYGRPHVYDLEFDYMLPSNKWVDLLWTSDATGKVKLYVNGIYNSSVTVPEGYNTFLPSELIGGELGQGFDGMLDELRIYAGSADSATAYDLTHPSGVRNSALAWWLFDEPSGSTAYDETGSGYDIELPPNSREPGMLRGGFYLSSTNTIALNAGWEGMTCWTVSAWLNPRKISGHQDLMRTPGVANLATHNWENGRVAYGRPHVYDLEFSYTLPASTWTHLLWTADGTRTVRLYVNGTYNSSVTVPSGYDTPCPGAIIGGEGGDVFDGVVDDLRIWNNTVFDEGAARIYGRSQKISYPQWSHAQWGWPLPENAAATNDFDGDGIANLAEFFLGLDPATPNTQSDLHDARLSISATNGICLHHYRRNNTTLKCRYQVSSDLQSWSNLVESVDFEEADRALDLSNEAVDLQLLSPDGNAGFFRILIEDSEEEE